MKRSIFPGFRSGKVKIPASKSMAHRLLIAAALGKSSVILHFDGFSNDIGATIVCLRALGAEITEVGDGGWRVTPIQSVPNEKCSLFCGESGSTLRFLLPIVGMLGADVVFHMEGRLPERPLEPLRTVLSEHGMKIEKTGNFLHCSGKLRGGKFEIAGNVSSQYISGLLLALPGVEEASAIRVEGAVESGAYIAMTENVLRQAGVQFEKNGVNYRISGGQKFRLPEQTEVEGDWSNAAFFLCMGALSTGGVTVEGLAMDSAQGDRKVITILREFGADVKIFPKNGAVEARREPGRGYGAASGTAPAEARQGCGREIDAREIPDLIPVLSVVAAVTEGTTEITNAGRLRLKESDRLSSTAGMLRALGADVTEREEGLSIRGVEALAGGTVDPCGDHRLAMAAAVAACAAKGTVTVLDSGCVAKSYPGFWNDFEALREEG